MNKTKKLVLALVAGMSVMAITGCTTTGIVNELVEADIITLPSINLDFLHNDKIELTSGLLDSWKSEDSAKSILADALKEKLDFGGSVRNYLSKTIPTNPSSDYFPINIEDLGTLYVISEAIKSF